MTANFKLGLCLTGAITLLGAREGVFRQDLQAFFRQVLQDKQDLEGSDPVCPVNPVPKKLSEYPFFTGKISDLIPAPNVFPYEVNAPLFSDYAQKARFIYLPEGQQMGYQPQQAFDFPNGAVLIKNFYYWKDERAPEKGRKILETRLLIKEEKGWKALEYLWNAEQTDAFLEVAGANFPHSWVDQSGKIQSLQYIAPNLNQCKGCHSFEGQFVPIGTTARQLNRTEQGVNQLVVWQNAGRLKLPEGFDPVNAPHLADYTLSDQELQTQFPDKAITDLSALRARAYLDGNCAHCHNPHGPASTSGMFLDAEQTDPEKLGIGKPPVAAGRGSGNRRYGIVPGKPKESILVFRMESEDPGIRMPELGRQLEHREGVELVKTWIREMK